MQAKKLLHLKVCTMFQFTFDVLCKGMCKKQLSNAAEHLDCTGQFKYSSLYLDFYMLLHLDYSLHTDVAHNIHVQSDMQQQCKLVMQWTDVCAYHDW